MLVLSRGQNDKVVFPSLGITVEILRVLGSRVRIGIEAPKDIPVLRDEVAAKDNGAAPIAGQPLEMETAKSTHVEPAISMHAINNRLQKATLALRLLQRMLEIGEVDNVESMIFKIFEEFKALEVELAPTNGAPVAVPQTAKGRRALIVEDDANELELLAAYLRLCGFEVDTATDGLQAMMQLSQNERPDVVLLDMKMPRLDGYKTVSAIRQNPNYQDLKIFAVTGTYQAENAALMGSEKVDQWFRKPIDPKHLVDAIHRELAGEFAPA
jgi:carbon storage regulator CsrA